MTQLTDNLGNTVTNRMELMKIATKFYEDLYTKHNNTSQSFTTVTYNTDSVPPFMESEIEISIRNLKTGKSPGPDKVTNEMIKAGKDQLIKPLTKLFNLILYRKEIPKSWTLSEIVLLYKKGDPKMISNYRPISLISCIYKVFASTLLRRITKPIDENQPIEQAGFMRKYSTIDHIHTLKIIMEKYTEYDLPLYIAFIDYSKAFDSISHSSIWKALTEQGIEYEYIDLIKAIYTNSMTRVRMETKGPSFQVERGVKQGDPLSPKIFIAVLESIFGALEWRNMGININGTLLTHLRFADDIVLLSESSEQLAHMLESLSHHSNDIGLQINRDKTKIMTNRDKKLISITSVPMEYVEEYVYLGHLISFRSCTEKEIKRRIKVTWNKYWSMKEIFKGDIPIKLKTKAMNICLMPCLTYACQTWPLTKMNLHKIKTCQRGIERSFLKIKLNNRIRSLDIRSKTKANDAVEQVLTLKWKWAGHIQRVRDKRWSQTVTNWSPIYKKRKRGRPQKRWSDDIVETAGAFWPRTAQDRERWQNLEEAFTAKGGPYI